MKLKIRAAKEIGEELTASNFLLMHCHVKNILMPRCVRERLKERKREREGGGMTSIFMGGNAVKGEGENSGHVFGFL